MVRRGNIPSTPTSKPTDKGFKAQAIHHYNKWKDSKDSRLKNPELIKNEEWSIFYVFPFPLLLYIFLTS